MWEQPEAVVDGVVGRAQSAYGAVTGDRGTQLEGEARRVVGGAKSMYGDLADEIRASAVTHPIGTVAVVAGLFFVLGALCARR